MLNFKLLEIGGLEIRNFVDMNFNLLYQTKDGKNRWVSVVFYLACLLLIVMVFSYLLLLYKVYMLHKKGNDLDQKIALYGSDQQKANEKQVFEYKKKIDDFTKAINSHKISLNLFNFIESKTLPNVWFSGFSASQVKNEVSLAGEAENMEAVSDQVHVFETSQDYIKSISLLSSQASEKGAVRFTLNISLNPNIFDYNVVTQMPAQ